MSRSLIIGLIITIAIISGLASFFYINFVKIKRKPAIDAVPSNAAIIFEVNDALLNWASFANTDMWKELQQNEAVGSLSKFLKSMDSIFSQNADMKSLIEDNKVICSIHPNLNGTNQLLFLLEINSNDDAKWIANWIEQSAKTTAIKRNFDKELIYEIQDINQKALFSFSFRDKILIISADATLVEDALRKLKYSVSDGLRTFEKAKAMTTGNTDITVYINYQVLPTFFASFSKDEYSKSKQYIQSFANWSALNIDIKKDHLGISGVTLTDDSVFQFLDLFKTQSAIEIDLGGKVPVATSFSMQFNFSNYIQFNSDLNEYLQNTNKLDEYTKYLDSVEERYHITIADNFVAEVGNTAFIGIHDGVGEDVEERFFSILHLKANAQNLFNSYFTAVQKRGEVDFIEQPYKEYTIKQLPIGNVFKLFFGHYFEHLNSPYYVQKDGVFILANSIATLKLIIDELDNGQTLSNDKSYLAHRKNSIAACNVTFFTSPGKCFQLANAFGNDDFISAINQNAYDVKKVEYIDVQYASSSSNNFLTNINITFNPSFKEETRVLWSTKLDTVFVMQPAVVYNTELKQNCIMVQDVMNNLYYINNSGVILWKTAMSGKINSQIFEVDANKTGELFYLFSTTKQACLVSNKGNNQYGYPVRFPGTATAGINLFDFYSDSTFQFFVPLDNNKIMGYQLNGRPIQGWNPKNIEAKITTRLSSIKLGVGAYLCASTVLQKLVIMPITTNQPQQTTFPAAASNYPVYAFNNDTSTATLWYTDTTGAFVMLNINQALEPSIVKTIAVETPNIYHLIVKSNETYYALSAGTYGFDLYNGDGAKILNRTFTDSSTTLPFFCYTKNNMPMLGYTELMKESVNLMDFKGNQYPSFPVKGYTPFITADLLQNNSNYLLCGDKSNNIMLYKLK